ncbi:hypothetical protein NPIL_375591 [Nephila pilipes]|uniref:Uncharacterized protein n=1 Tax=Nephila pilipes TaxID=299642 RepID=A0A8X6MVL9_NEPPI|nr:hypothetical protein NPIL_375591 [Nephila pilipes]
MGPNGGKRKGPAEDGESSSHPDNTLITQSASLGDTIVHLVLDIRHSHCCPFFLCRAEQTVATGKKGKTRFPFSNCPLVGACGLYANLSNDPPTPQCRRTLEDL